MFIITKEWRGYPVTAQTANRKVYPTQDMAEEQLEELYRESSGRVFRIKEVGQPLGPIPTRKQVKEELQEAYNQEQAEKSFPLPNTTVVALQTEPQSPEIEENS